MLSNKVCTFSQKKLFWTLHEELVQPKIWTVYGPSTLEHNVGWGESTCAGWRANVHNPESGEARAKA
jgi:hypothetical protein